MKPPERDIQILQKLISECKELEALLDGFKLEGFLSDERTKRAVAMTLINVGELVKNLSSETKVINPDIPWKAIAGLRDVAAHHYGTIRMEDMWETATKDVPVFLAEIQTITK